MYEIVNGMEQLAKELGVTFQTNAPVEKIKVNQKGPRKATEI